MKAQEIKNQTIEVIDCLKDNYEVKQVILSAIIKYNRYKELKKEYINLESTCPFELGTKERNDWLHDADKQFMLMFDNIKKDIKMLFDKLGLNYDSDLVYEPKVKKTI